MPRPGRGGRGGRGAGKARRRPALAARPEPFYHRHQTCVPCRASSFAHRVSRLRPPAPAGTESSARWFERALGRDPRPRPLDGASAFSGCDLPLPSPSSRASPSGSSWPPCEREPFAVSSFRSTRSLERRRGGAPALAVRHGLTRLGAREFRRGDATIFESDVTLRNTGIFLAIKTRVPDALERALAATRPIATRDRPWSSQ
jgi:hypothetical protein